MKKQNQRPKRPKQRPYEPDKYYAVQVIPGLEKQAEEEIKAKIEDASVVSVIPSGERNTTIVIALKGGSMRPEQLSLVEDLFRIVVDIPKVEMGVDGLAQIEKEIFQSDLWNEAFLEWRLLHHVRARNRIVYRIVSRADASNLFSRHSLKRHVEKMMDKFEKPKWSASDEESEVEVWLQHTKQRLLAMLRLSDQTMRHRTYKAQHLPASLRPTVAAAMVMYGDPKPSDRFIDPMCGAGTLPIERALWGPARMVAGGDIDPEALFCCKENSTGIKHPPDWVHWDARALPFPDYSIDRVAANLPFGEKHGEVENLPWIYTRVVAEVGRVLRPGGIAVFLTSEKKILLNAVGRRGPLYLMEFLDINLLGRKAYMIKLIRK